MIIPKGIEQKLSDHLTPIQPVVIGLLVVVILAAVWLILQPNPTVRTAGLLWFLLP